MKSDAVLINASRGDVIVQDDLIEALQNGRIGAAGLDVCTPEPIPLESPLLQLANVFMLPHIGSASENARLAMAKLVSQNIIDAVEGNDSPTLM